MEQIILPPLPTAFENLPDPRKPSGKRYSLKSMLTSAIAALMQGATGVTSISQWTRSQSFGDLFRLGFQTGKAPCPATYYNLFFHLDTIALEQCLQSYFKPLLDNEDVLSIDGKALRGSRDGDSSPVHLLSVLGQKTLLVFNEKFVNQKTNEIKVIIPLLEDMDLEGKIITADAMHTQKNFANGPSTVMQITF